MVKKIYLTLLSATLFSSAYAFQPPGDYYIGGTLGYGLTEQKLNGFHDAPSGKIDGDQWELSAISGLAWNGLNGSYVGIEGEIEFSREGTDKFNNEFTGDNWGVSAGVFGRAGWWFWNSTLFYGKIGVKETYMSFSDGGSGAVQSMEYGIGAEYILNLDWTIRGEYSHEKFSSNDDIFKGYSLKSSENKFSIGLMRHF